MNQDYEEKSLSFSAKKSLGQNFLHAPNIISAMAHAGNAGPDSIVLEIGPGKGALTKTLLASGSRVIAIEKDDRAIPFLNELFKNEIESGQLSLIHDDVLLWDLEKYGLKKDEYVVIANIPYYISGEFMRKFLETAQHPQKIVVMLQKELAKRIVDSKESILSLSVKAYGSPKYLVTVPRKLFRPIPNVDSAVLVIDTISKKFFEESGIPEARFFEIIKAGFAHKRKVLIRNLEVVMDPAILRKIWETEQIPLTARAENLSLEMWKKIIGYNHIS